MGINLVTRYLDFQHAIRLDFNPFFYCSRRFSHLYWLCVWLLHYINGYPLLKSNYIGNLKKFVKNLNFFLIAISLSLSIYSIGSQVFVTDWRQISISLRKLLIIPSRVHTRVTIISQINFFGGLTPWKVIFWPKKLNCKKKKFFFDHLRTFTSLVAG